MATDLKMDEKLFIYMGVELLLNKTGALDTQGLAAGGKDAQAYELLFKLYDLLTHRFQVLLVAAAHDKGIDFDALNAEVLRQYDEQMAKVDANVAAMRNLENGTKH